MDIKRILRNSGLMGLVVLASISLACPPKKENRTEKLPNGTEIVYSSYVSDPSHLEKERERYVIKKVLTKIDEEILRIEGVVTYIGFAKVNPGKLKSLETTVISQSAHAGGALISGGDASNNAQVPQKVDDVVIIVKPSNEGAVEYVLNIQKEGNGANPASLIDYIKSGDKISFPIAKKTMNAYLYGNREVEIMNQVDTYSPSDIRKLDIKK